MWHLDISWSLRHLSSSYFTPYFRVEGREVIVSNIQSMCNIPHSMLLFSGQIFFGYNII